LGVNALYLNIEQRKLIQAKPSGHGLIKGVAGSGKTTVAVHRVPFLLNNYCFAKDDKILLVTFNKTLVNYISYLYNKVEDEEVLGFQTLFQASNDKLEINTIDSIIFEVFRQYRKSSKAKYEVSFDNKVKHETLGNCIAELSKKYNAVKVLDHRYQSFLLQEIEWIKACNYVELEEYQNADRYGRTGKVNSEGPQRLNKNSETRLAIFELMQLYSKKLKNSGLIDPPDMALIALDHAKKNMDQRYTHIIIDESQDLTRVQIEFLKLLYKGDKEYSSFWFICDTAQSIYPYSWLVKGRSFTSIDFDMTGKSNSLAKNYRTTTQIAMAAYSLLEADRDIVDDENFVQPSLIDRQGEFPIYRQFATPAEEAEYVINVLSAELLKRYDHKDIVIVAKNRNQLTYMKQCLDKANILGTVLDKNQADFDSQSIKLLTMHSIKGLEFKIVIIIGLNKGVIPYDTYKDLEESGVAESADRKLLYVGMTRAHERLCLTSSAAPSKFIEDINPKFLKLSSNGRVSKFYNVPLEEFLFKAEIVDNFSCEEKVRQWVLKELLDTYKYPLSLIDIEYKVNNFSKIGSVDIAVSIYSNSNRVPYIFVETKALGKGVKSGLEQLKSYMSNSRTCQYGIVTDGNELIVLNKDLEIIEDIPLFNPSMLPSTIQKHKYVDLKYNRNYIIEQDSETKGEFAVQCDMGRVEYQGGQVLELPVYNNIAAGAPINIDPVTEESFDLPMEWFKGKEGCFLLRVRGDSMIGAGIDDGDLVVIQRQETAQNRDIVAVTIDEDATLKRFMKMGGTVLLIPENDKFEPIQMSGDQVKVIGLAIGVIKLLENPLQNLVNAN
jgi:DNA helicase II / ATP-dependent DNA helicase PcrA